MPISEIFGHPGVGIHQHVFGIAIWDVVMTIIIAIVFAYFANVSVWRAILGFMIVAEGAHVAFGVDTAVTRLFSC